MYPWLRLTRIGPKLLAKPDAGLLQTTRIRMRVWPNDLDLNGHVNNGRYLALADIGRIHWLGRTGVLRTARMQRVFPVVGDAIAKFRRDLTLFQSFEIHTRLLGWDRKWGFIEQRFVRHDRVIGVVAIRGVFKGRDGPVDPAAFLTRLGHRAPSPALPQWAVRFDQSAEVLSTVLRQEEQAPELDGASITNGALPRDSTSEPPREGWLTLEALAIAAGTSSAVVARLATQGLLSPVDTDDRYPPSHVSWIRLLVAHENAGLSLDAIAEGARSRGFSLAFIDQLMPTPARLMPETYGQVAVRIDATPGLVKAIRNVLGTAAASDDEHVREDDAAIFRLAVRAKELGGDDEQLARGFRTMADAVRRSVRVQRDFIDEVLIQPVIAAGASESQALQATAAVRREYRTIGADLMMLLLRRFMDDAIFQGIVELGERALQRDGTDHARAPSAPAIVFVDVSGYTSLAEKSGDEAAAHSAARFASLVDDIGSAHGGRLVKLLGDGAMLAFPSAASAVRCGFELIARARQEGLPPLHIGVDAGAVVRRDGDYFGSVVNIASRVADRAGPGQLLVTDKVVNACDDEHDLRFTVTGPAVLKNVARPITLYLAGTTS